MQKILFAGALVWAAVAAAPASSPVEVQPGQIIALERAALDRWGRGDPEGFLSTYAPEVTYFDPSTPKRIDGLAAMRERYAPITGKVKVDSYDMIDPKVQGQGDVVVLSYNLASRGRNPAGDSLMTFHWNSSTVYARIGGHWKILHSHWSFSAPPETGAVRRP
jgi:ketosteroid isomerase-like protein